MSPLSTFVDKYKGLDRFGRIVDQRWLRTSDGSATDRFQYGHDRDGNRLYRDNRLNTAFSELYHANGPAAGYDNFGQLLAFARGELSDSNMDLIPDTVASPSRTRSWAFDELGNWGTLTTTVGGGTPQTESRSHNRQNQITGITGVPGPQKYDNNGNLTDDGADKGDKGDMPNRYWRTKGHA
jgi:hypothetical protein